jgi:hypothetical protein
VTRPGAATAGPNAVPGDPSLGRPGPTATKAVVARHEFGPDEPRTCRCGCGRPVPIRRHGPARIYATDACRAAVYRRNRAGVPADLPRQPNHHGRRSLAATQRT